ncbi:MAG: hypothetical protein WBB18_03260 [Nodosilinea sp.]
MFLKTSRYYQVPQTNATLSGRAVRAIRLRRLPTVQGVPYVVQGQDRLDILAQRQYGDATQPWRIADANTEPEANKLVKTPLREIQI